jgi:hypothetical protein
MIRIQSGGPEKYLEDGAVSELDYYEAETIREMKEALATGNPPGRWVGRGAERLGLSGDVDQKDFSSVYYGVRPRPPITIEQIQVLHADQSIARLKKRQSEIGKEIKAAEKKPEKERTKEEKKALKKSQSLRAKNEIAIKALEKIIAPEREWLERTKAEGTVKLTQNADIPGLLRSRLRDRLEALLPPELNEREQRKKPEHRGKDDDAFKASETEEIKRTRVEIIELNKILAVAENQKEESKRLKAEAKKLNYEAKIIEFGVSAVAIDLAAAAEKRLEAERLSAEGDKAGAADALRWAGYYEKGRKAADGEPARATELRREAASRLDEAQRVDASLSMGSHSSGLEIVRGSPKGLALIDVARPEKRAMIAEMRSGFYTHLAEVDIQNRLFVRVDGELHKCVAATISLHEHGEARPEKGGKEIEGAPPDPFIHVHAKSGNHGFTADGREGALSSDGFDLASQLAIDCKHNALEIGWLTANGVAVVPIPHGGAEGAYEVVEISRETEKKFSHRNDGILKAMAEGKSHEQAWSDGRGAKTLTKKELMSGWEKELSVDVNRETMAAQTVMEHYEKNNRVALENQIPRTEKEIIAKLVENQTYFSDEEIRKQCWIEMGKTLRLANGGDVEFDREQYKSERTVEKIQRQIDDAKRDAKPYAIKKGESPWQFAARMEQVVEKKVAAIMVSAEVIKVSAETKAKFHELNRGQDRVQKTYFASRNMLLSELNVAALAKEINAESHKAVSVGDFEKALKKSEAANSAKTGTDFRYKDEQKGVARKLFVDTTSRLKIIQAYAGAGKTTTDLFLMEIWEGQNGPGSKAYQTICLGTSNRAVAEIVDSTGKKSGEEAFTVSKFVQQYRQDKNGRGCFKDANGDTRYLTDKTLLILDEASMIGTLDAERFLEIVNRHKCVAILQGDPAQMPSVSAGRPYQNLCQDETIDSARIVEITRQKKEWANKMVVAAETGDFDKAVDLLKKNNALKVYANHADKNAAIVRDYINDEVELKDKIITFTARQEVEDANTAIQRELHARGVIDLSKTTKMRTEYASHDIGLVSVAVGDKIIFQERVTDIDNPRKTGEKNQTAFVKKIIRARDGDRVVVDIGVKKEKLLTLKVSEMQAGLGYAMTVHRSQGLTAKSNRFGHKSGRLSASQTATVALSRAEDEVVVYASEQDSATLSEDWQKSLFKCETTDLIDEKQIRQIIDDVKKQDGVAARVFGGGRAGRLEDLLEKKADLIAETARVAEINKGHKTPEAREHKLFKDHGKSKPADAGTQEKEQEKVEKQQQKPKIEESIHEFFTFANRHFGSGPGNPLVAAGMGDSPAPVAFTGGPGGHAARGKKGDDEGSERNSSWVRRLPTLLKRAMAGRGPADSLFLQQDASAVLDARDEEQRRGDDALRRDPDSRGGGVGQEELGTAGDLGAGAELGSGNAREVPAVGAAGSGSGSLIFQEGVRTGAETSAPEGLGLAGNPLPAPAKPAEDPSDRPLPDPREDPHGWLMARTAKANAEALAREASRAERDADIEKMLAEQEAKNRASDAAWKAAKAEDDKKLAELRASKEKPAPAAPSAVDSAAKPLRRAPALATKTEHVLSPGQRVEDAAVTIEKSMYMIRETATAGGRTYAVPFDDRLSGVLDFELADGLKIGEFAAGKSADGGNVHIRAGSGGVVTTITFDKTHTAKLEHDKNGDPLIVYFTAGADGKRQEIDEAAWKEQVSGVKPAAEAEVDTSASRVPKPGRGKI